MQVVPAIQCTAHGALHVGKLCGVQRTGHLGGQTAVPRHDPVRREIIQRLVQHAQAAGGVFCHAPAAQAGKLKIRRLGAVQLVQGVLLEEQRIAHAGSRPGKGAVAAHGDSVAVCSDAPVAEPVGGVAQLAAVDNVLPAVAAPHTVVALGHKIQFRHPALHGYRLRGVHTAVLFAVHALPLRGGGVLHQCAVKILALRGAAHPQPVLAHVIHDLISVQLRALPRSLGGCALHGHGVPLPEQLAQPCRRDAAVFQRDGRPAAGVFAVHFQRAVVPPRMVGILHP